MRPHKYLTPTDLSNSSLKRLFNKHNKSSQLTLTLASLGLLLLLVGTFTLPFNQGLFSQLFIKPASHADTSSTSSPIMDMAFPCGFTNPAFCDNFSEGPATGVNRGRGNDLDSSKWSFNRISGINNGGGSMFVWPQIPQVEHCKTLASNVNAPNDSFFCGSEVPEPEHWMEAFDDGGSYLVNNGRIRQPFDFTNRMGTIQYGVDAKNSGGHGWWLETWITDSPVPAPHENPGSGSGDHPRNGIGIRFTNSCNASIPPDFTVHGIGVTGPNAVVITNYQVSKDYSFTPDEEIPSNSPQNCFKTQDDMSNLIQIKLSTTRLEVWASDAGSNVLTEKYAVNINPPLPFSVGYVNFVHGGYNASKCYDDKTIFCNHFQTYHWHDMGFDGPIHPTPKSYEIPDSLTPCSGNGCPTGGLNLGYMVMPDGTIYDGAKTIPDFTFNNVDLTGAASANLNFSTQRFGPGQHIFYQFNSGPWRTYTYAPPDTYAPESVGHSIPIDLTDLQQGTNTLHLKSDGNVLGAGPNTAQLGNIELEVVPADSSTPAPAVGTIPCSLFNLMMTTMPSMTMLTDPCSMSPNPSMSAMPSPTSTSNGLNISNSVTPQTLTPGQTVNLNVNVSNSTATNLDGGITVSIINPVGTEVMHQLIGNNPYLYWLPNMPKTYTIPYTLPSNAALGTYTVEETISETNISGVTTFYAYPSVASFMAAPSMPTTTPTPSVTPSSGRLIGDFNSDGQVNLTDLSIFSASYGTVTPNIPNPQCDLNGDGKVNLSDLSIFASSYGT